ncbi:MAG: hypothetical protein BJ554DRAFT_2996, partial [Olpidium bornovanus]
ITLHIINVSLVDPFAVRAEEERYGRPVPAHWAPQPPQCTQYNAVPIADLLKIPHLTSSHTAGLHDQHYLASQSLSRQADVVAALASPRLLQLYAAVVAGLLFRELRNSRPFLYKCVVQLAHWLKPVLAPLRSPSRPPYHTQQPVGTWLVLTSLAGQDMLRFGDIGNTLSPRFGLDSLDFWLAFIGHAFVAFAGAYSVLLLDGEMTVINAVQAQAATGAVLVIGPEASMALLGGAATEFVALGDGENANNANNQDHEHGQGGGPSFLAKIASSVAGLLGINISSASATTLIGVVMRNYSSIPILSTGLAWLFLMHHHTPIELLPLVIFPCVETAAAWHGRNVAPWFSSASRLAFIVVLINGWYNGTASWGLTPFLLLCLGKPFLLLLFLSATGPVMVCQLLGKFAVRAWRKAFPPPGVALANEGPRIHYPGAAETGDQPAAAPVDPSASSAGGSSVREEGRRRVEDDERRERERRRRDELLDELDDLIEDARKMGVDASYRTPLHAGTSADGISAGAIIGNGGATSAGARRVAASADGGGRIVLAVRDAFGIEVDGRGDARVAAAAAAVDTDRRRVRVLLEFGPLRPPGAVRALVPVRRMQGASGIQGRDEVSRLQAGSNDVPEVG